MSEAASNDSTEKTYSDPKTERAVRFFTYLPQTDDMTLLILKGHLLIEEQLSLLQKL